MYNASSPYVSWWPMAKRSPPPAPTMPLKLPFCLQQQKFSLFVPQSQYPFTVFLPGVYLLSKMQLPSSSNQLQGTSSTTPARMPSTLPPHYSSYFVSVSGYAPQAPLLPFQNRQQTSTSSQPIRINSSIPRATSSSYDLTERVMGLSFDRPTSKDSFYAMDYMECSDDDSQAIDSHPPSGSCGNQRGVGQLGEVLRRTGLENKENGAEEPLPGFSQNLRPTGSYGYRAYKRRSSFDDDRLVHEETESETGLSDVDDDCVSQCGCVHSHPASVNSSIPRHGFRTIGDIIGYAQVVRAERLEALAELRNTFEKFNSMPRRRPSQE